MNKQLEVIRTGFDERKAWAAERQALLNEIASLRRAADRHELSEEIAQTESELIQVRASIDDMSNDPSTGMAKLVRATVREAELQAYLKGLLFKASLRDTQRPVPTEAYA